METIIVEGESELTRYRAAQQAAVMGALDIETTITENPWVDLPILVSVAITFDGETAFVFSGDRRLLGEAQLSQTPWIMHNGLFDKLMLKLMGYETTLKHDTMAMQYLLDPDEPKSLQALSTKYLGAPEYKDVDYKNILDEPFEKVARMNAQDVCYTFKLFRPLANQINNDPALSRIYQWIIMPVITELIHVTLNGIPVDTTRLDPLVERVEAEVAEMREWLENFTAAPRAEDYPSGWPKPSWWRVREHGKWAGDKFNPGSPKQVRHIVYDVWQLPPIAWTNNENNPQPTTDADTLLQLETFYANPEQAEWLHNLREYRKRSKLLQSYLRSWPDYMDEAGWMHPRYKPLHVVTGRLSSEKPNIQQVPRDQEFRDLFGGVPGWTWVKADYSQIELRVAAWLSNETKMLEAYERGDDLHTLTAKLVLKSEDPDARQVGKTLNFGLLYGAGPKTLQRVARSQYEVFLNETEARIYHERFFEAYPGLRSWQDKMQHKLIQTGVVRSPLGRIRYLPKAKIPWSVEDMRTKKIQAIHEGLNHPVQSFANDLLLHSLLTAAPEFRKVGAKVVAVVHDEIDVLVPDDKVEFVKQTLKRVMEDTSWLQKFGIVLDVPLLADVQTGPYWGSLE